MVRAKELVAQPTRRGSLWIAVRRLRRGRLYNVMLYALPKRVANTATWYNLTQPEAPKDARVIRTTTQAKAIPEILNVLHVCLFSRKRHKTARRPKSTDTKQRTTKKHATKRHNVKTT